MPAPEFTLPTTGTSPRIATSGGLEAGINAVSQALFDQIGAISTGLKPAGNWDASTGSFPSGAERGTYYVVNVAGTVDGAAFAIGDWLVPLVDGPETGMYVGNWFRGDYSKVVPAKPDSAAAFEAGSDVSRGPGALWETKDGYRYEEVTTGEDLTNAAGVKLRTITTQTAVAAAFYSGDWGEAITAASRALSERGGGAVLLPAGEIVFDTCTVFRGTIFSGSILYGSALKQTAGANRDFIVSENFAALTGTEDTVAENPLCPSFFGLANVRVDGNRQTAANPTGNTSGYAVAFYGSAIIFQGSVLVHNGADGGIYSEYGTGLGSDGWTGQEEGDFGTVTVRDNGGTAGWLFRGPHNSKLNRVVANYNDGWGFKSEGLPYDGGMDYIACIHSYANGRGSDPASDTGVSLGAIARIGTLITDGDNLGVTASKVQIGLWRSYNAGGAMNGGDISGNNIYIGHLNMEMWASSTGKKALHWSGDHGNLGGLTLITSSPDNDGLVIDGAEGNFSNLDVKGFSGAGRLGVQNNGSNNRINGQISLCDTNFDQAAGQSNNRVDLTIITATGQTAVGGAAPGVTDIFTIRSSGAGQAGRTMCAVQTDLVAADTTIAGTITVDHGLLYTPNKHGLAVTLLQSSPDDANLALAYARVNSVSATSVTIGFRFATAGAAGTRVRFSVTGSVA